MEGFTGGGSGIFLQKVGTEPPVPRKRKQNVKLVYNFRRFPVQNLGLNEYEQGLDSIFV